VGFGQQAEEIDATPRDAGVGGKCDHRYIARTRDLPHRLHGWCKERTENDFRTIVHSLLADLLSGRCITGIVTRQHLDVCAELPHREFCGVPQDRPTAPSMASRAQGKDKSRLARASPKRITSRWGRRSFRRRASADLTAARAPASAASG